MNRNSIIKVSVVVIFLIVATWKITQKMISPESNMAGYWLLLWPLIAAAGAGIIIFILLWLLDYLKNSSK